VGGIVTTKRKNDYRHDDGYHHDDHWYFEDDFGYDRRKAKRGRPSEADDYERTRYEHAWEIDEDTDHGEYRKPGKRKKYQMEDRYHREESRRRKSKWRKKRRKMKDMLEDIFDAFD
jgi:hypothetical protein